MSSVSDDQIRDELTLFSCWRLTPRKAWISFRALFVSFNSYYFIGIIFLMV